MKKHINKHNAGSFVFSAIPIIIHIVLYIVYKVNTADDDLSDLISSMGEFVIILPIVLLSSGAIYFFFFEKRYTLAVISNTVGRIAELWFYKSIIDFPSKFGISAICLEIAEIVLFLAICYVLSTYNLMKHHCKKYFMSLKISINTSKTAMYRNTFIIQTQIVTT